MVDHHPAPPPAAVRHLQAVQVHRRRVRKIEKLARRLVGFPYRWGGDSPASGFDCSGLVYFILRRNGVQVPRTTYATAVAGRRVYGRPRPGDVILFNRDEHEALYLGGGMIVEASHTGSLVHIRPLYQYYQARRLF